MKIARAKPEEASRLTALEIESDPFAEGFYLRMGAQRIGERAYALEGRPRVLPILVYAVR